ncbi:tail fiber domain-containing protein [Dyadobacter sp. BHUBP1]|uniref:tail fiber domain-containing protein n=1 Tax=Dyadobacter sp. BHUBP1 TaxID=3424178 RepID=UPI003D3370E8
MKQLITHLSGYFKTAAAPMSLSSKAFTRSPKVTFVILLSVSLLLLLQSQSSQAQAPQQFSFQGVARDAAGKIVANKSILVGFNIHQGSANGQSVFSETHNTNTNANGIFTLQIGSITSLSNINWGANSYFLQTTMYYDGLPAQVDLGTTQLLSVPYAINALNANKSITSDTAVVAKKWIDNEPIVQTGYNGAGATLPTLPVGNLLIWYPQNAAFRVGKNAGNKWNQASMGINSFATGEGTLASGENSASFGQNTEATGDNAFALGAGSKASGAYSFSSGFNANASGSKSAAIGENAVASSTNAFAVGLNSQAINAGAIAIGYNSKAAGANALAFGEGSEATGQNSISFGNSTASGLRSFAVGEGALAKAVGGIAIGTYNNSGDFPGAQPAATDRIFQLGHGTSANRSNAITVLRNGYIGIGDNATNPSFTMDFGGRPRIRNSGGSMTAGLHLDDSQGNADNFVGMLSDTQIGFYLNNAWRFWVDDVHAYVNGFTVNTSDRRLKKDLVPLETSISKLKTLQGYFYKWLDPKRDQSIQTGLMAQDVEIQFPELVATEKDGYKAVNYTGFIPHLIEAVKELDKKTEEIAALKKELASVQEMNKKLSALEASIKELLAGQTSISTQTSK